MWVAMLAVVAATVVQIVYLGEIGKKLASLCHTLYFILPNTLNSMVNVVFILIGIKISRSINEYNAG